MADEEIVFNRLDMERDATWSLLLASGYLKVVGTEDDGLETEYELAVTSFETLRMFKKWACVIRYWSQRIKTMME